MKSICITGFPGSDLKMVASILGRAGMKAPKPSRQDETLDISLWHEQVLSASDEEQSADQAVFQTGKLWEQLARDIFLANLKTPLWGWADARSVWALDFWLEFEPKLNFLLVYTSPQRALFNAMSSRLEQEDGLADFEQAWLAHYQEILRFHHRHPKRTLMVDASECAADPEALVRACAEHWELKLGNPGTDETCTADSDLLATYLAEQLLETQPQLQTLQNEIEASVQRLDPNAESLPTSASSLALDEAVAEYFMLRRQASELPELTGQLEQLAAENEALSSQLDQVQEELVWQGLDNQNTRRELTEQQNSLAILSTANAELAAERDAQNQLASRLEVELKDFRQENGLLLSQLHQVQEELEQYFLRERELQHTVQQLEALKQEKTALAGENAKLIAARDEQTKLAAERQTQVQALTQEKTALAGENAKLIATRDEQQGQHARQLEDQAKLATELRGSLKDARQENELLLLQLHQVQEELEHYFLKLQETQKQSQQIEARWQRMLERSPGYCDYETIKVLDIQGKGDGQLVSWSISDLHSAGRDIKKLTFKTFIENGTAGFIFQQTSDSEEKPLLRWPSGHEKQTDLHLIPVVNKDNYRSRIEALTDLSTSDWALLQTLCGVLIEELGAPDNLKISGNLETRLLRDALKNLLETLQGFPGFFRYDRVTLKRELTNPDYEYLWLQFENIAFGAQRWPQFEFRFSCTNEQPNQFGTHPKLEFPAETGQKPFEKWFAVSRDNFGENLELRFALPEAIDIAVWGALSHRDRDLLTTLINRLPSALHQLQQAGIKTTRPWDAWLHLATSVSQIVLKLTKKQSSAPAKQIEAAPAQMAHPESANALAKTPKTAPASASVKAPAKVPAKTPAKAPAKAKAKAPQKTVARPIASNKPRAAK
jgi:hypothetical protein